MASQSCLPEREKFQNTNLVIYLLNCAKNQPCTVTTIQHFADNPNCIAFPSQEPWCENNELPPLHPYFDCFTPTAKRPGAVTYIRRNRGIETTVIFTHAHSFIGTTLLLPGLPCFTLYNMYSPEHPKHLAKLIESLKPKPSSIFYGKPQCSSRMVAGVLHRPKTKQPLPNSKTEKSIDGNSKSV
jgi:hypothetical protein